MPVSDVRSDFTVQLYRILKARYNQIKYKLMKETLK